MDELEEAAWAEWCVTAQSPQVECDTGLPPLPVRKGLGVGGRAGGQNPFQMKGLEGVFRLSQEGHISNQGFTHMLLFTKTGHNLYFDVRAVLRCYPACIHRIYIP